MLSDLSIGDFRTFARLSPPLRSAMIGRPCSQAMADGTIDVIASGHDPRGPEDKRLPFADAEPGMAGAETLLPLTLGLVRDGVIDGRAFELLASNPAVLLGVNAGRLERGQRPIWRSSIRTNRGSSIRTRWRPLRAIPRLIASPVQGRVTALFKGGAQVD
jgi:dihydroorotase